MTSKQNPRHINYQFYGDSRCANIFFRKIREESRIIKIVCHDVSDLGHSPGSS